MVRLTVILLLLCFSFQLHAGGDLLSIGYPPDPIDVGEVATVDVVFDHPAGLSIQSWTFGVCHNGAVLAVEEVGLGEVTQAMNGGAGPSTFEVSITSEGFEVAVTTSFTGLSLLPVGEEMGLHQVSYVAVEPGFTELTFCAALGLPEFTDVSGAVAIPPTVPGCITVEAETSTTGSDYHLYFAGDTTPVETDLDGTLFSVRSMLDFPSGNDVQGWSMSVCTYGANIRVDNVVEGATLAPLLPDFSIIEVLPGQGWLAACVIDFMGVQTLPQGVGYELYDAEYHVINAGPAEICYCDHLINPPGVVPTETTVTAQSATLNPVRSCHEIDVQPSGSSGRKIYWTDVGHNKIRRSNLDGSNLEELVTTGLDAPGSIVVEPTLGKMFWTDWAAATAHIKQANLDGSDPEIIIEGLSGPYGISVDAFGGKIYWTEFSSNRIRRANLDGTNIEDLITTGLSHVNGITLDLAAQKMYWTDQGFPFGTIERANLDGSDRETLINTVLVAPMEIALDPAGGKLYWCDLGTDVVHRANMDGSDIENIVTSTFGTPVGIAIDPLTDRVFWSDSGSGGSRLRSANLDGSGIVDVVASGIGSCYGLTLATVSLDPPTMPGASFIRGDTNGDGLVGIADAISGLDALFSMGPMLCSDANDVNDDTLVNIADIIFLLDALFGMGTPPPAPYPGCGEDPSADPLSCEVYAACP